ncbi:hypothetical protein CHU92_06965 [Flavobacterium cyanobacteriorum]|uniref:Outer membrane protein beta-barrel domain-containing protein n=1 Tax=Flavobacterium cyanobacteriorum TaxID=2022802 RepID=A0A255Z9B5_9FLAO|nr:outer membrane beta-barrel protein [Flavobacterium cyanobacteriorum]OYQ38036.1 hypothetical protein CHU92_06965 [Flavobacterium cyanobacteriorum]
MKKLVFALALITANLAAYAQPRAYDQVSIEADYGFNGSTHNNQTITGINHFGIGFRYMIDDTWGVKFDYANDRFRLDGNGDEGTDYNRFSLQGVYNLGRTLDIPWNTMDRLNLLLHAGLGYAAITSKMSAGIDNVGHAVAGLTPQIYISEAIAIHIDASYILNFSQHFNFDGSYPPGRILSGDWSGFSAGMFTASAGLTFYIGKSKSKADWR